MKPTDYIRRSKALVEFLGYEYAEKDKNTSGQGYIPFSGYWKKRRTIIEVLMTAKRNPLFPTYLGKTTYDFGFGSDWNWLMYAWKRVRDVHKEAILIFPRPVYWNLVELWSKVMFGLMEGRDPEVLFEYLTNYVLFYQAQQSIFDEHRGYTPGA